MQLTLNGIKSPSEWQKNGIKLPSYDIFSIRQKTLAMPTWLHIGAGNIFRGYIACIVDRLIENKLITSGIIAAEGYDSEIVYRSYLPFDNLSLLVTLQGDGDIKKQVLAPIADILDITQSIESAVNYFCAKSLQIVSFTITEKGYCITEDVLQDMAEPSKMCSLMGKLTILLFKRFKAGGEPLALLSLDNCSNNGEKLYNIVNSIATQWQKHGYVDDDFIHYIQDATRVSFPISMIDKITPRPDNFIQSQLDGIGLEDTEIICTNKQTYTSNFVNTEEKEYLVIEDNFPNGRPPLEAVGVLMTTREKVSLSEKMKVSTCLNPVHTALAVFGCLLSYKKISDEMGDPLLRTLVTDLLYKESLKVCVNPQIIMPEAFVNEVLNERLPNSYLPDTPFRIVTDTSQKLAVRFGETIKAYVNSGLDASKLVIIPLVFAGWCRYLMEVDDNGIAYQSSADPLLKELLLCFKGATLGSEIDITEILNNANIFGVNLQEVGLFNTVKRYFNMMTAGTGAVRKTLEFVLGGKI